jgi:hypothetical protein
MDNSPYMVSMRDDTPSVRRTLSCLASLDPRLVLVARNGRRPELCKLCCSIKVHFWCGALATIIRNSVLTYPATRSKITRVVRSEDNIAAVVLFGVSPTVSTKSIASGVLLLLAMDLSS